MGKRLYLTPVRLAFLSFVVLILMGTLLLMLPDAVTSTHPISFIDALFTATSAVCVTGLIVQDTATYFTAFGQTIIVILIQLGGLGIMTLYAAMPVIFGRQLSPAQRATFSELFAAENYKDLRLVLVSIIKYTLIIELVGAIILSVRFYADSHNPWQAAAYGIFHSISGFCNAGFSLFTTSLNAYVGDWTINLTMMLLIMTGGLGFVVLREILQKRSWRKFNSHSKLTLVLTGILILVPSFFVFHFEFLHAFKNMDMGDRVLATFFQTVQTRTSGFNTVDTFTLSQTTLYLYCILMFIGAGSGGTAGGVKVSTVGLMFLSLKSIVQGRDEIDCYKKRVPSDVVTRSIAIIVISFSVVTFAVLLLTLTEQAGFFDILFETISAFGTVGLSMGLTGKLTAIGKFLICVVMLVGRVGSLSLIFLLGDNLKRAAFRYPEGRFIVG